MTINNYNMFFIGLKYIILLVCKKVCILTVPITDTGDLATMC